MPDDRVPPTTYDQDFDAWSLSQAAAPRAVAAAIDRGEIPANARLLALDWDNLADEIESLGKRDRRELGSRLELIVEHLLKLEFSGHGPPRAGWISSVRRERSETAMLLEDSPSLRRLVPDLIRRRHDTAMGAVLAALEAHGEHADTSTRLLCPYTAPYTAANVLGSWLPDAPTG